MRRRKGSKKIVTESATGLFSQPEDPLSDPLFFFDNSFGKRPLAGIDEVGRGPLAGPIVACAVILDPLKEYPGVDDSKKLSHEERLELSHLIKETALAWTLAFKSPKEVDQLNPLQATLKAMAEAYQQLELKPQVVLIDGTVRPPIDAQVVPIVKGDSKSLSIAAASILAKVARDTHMLEEHKRYPQYGFDRHKGYGTKEHLLALAHYGPSPIHRLTYRSVLPPSPRPRPFGGGLF
ncbi:MAG: ribonuclease HII [Deltaproteobacteria bacterium]|jgi:ribonuclease HII|nr:ribonuclease HII [Deltaproteobacteria bacterium]